MKQNLVIINAGKFGRETFTWAVQAMAHGAPWQIKGFLDDRVHILDGFAYEAPILGNVANYRIEEGDVFIGAIGEPRDRVKYYTPIVERGGRFINLIHPLANIGKNVQLGTGIIMAPFSSVTCDVRIGNHVSIGALSNVGHDTTVGDWCQISSHCGLNGKASIGDGVYLGSHSCLLPNVKVGAWSLVGAGSIVLKDVPPGVKVFGNPAIVVGRAEGVGGSRNPGA
jgi:sugar O-acyltransferase (sialic acid O-acetyltransferase NeuD family)